MVEGIFLAVGGALLLTPGFITDAFGFACLLPGIRHVIIAWGIKHIDVKSFATSSRSCHSHHTSDDQLHSRSSRQPDGHVIDGEYRREDD